MIVYYKLQIKRLFGRWCDNRISHPAAVPQRLAHLFIEESTLPEDERLVRIDEKIAIAHRSGQIEWFDKHKDQWFSEILPVM